MPQFTKSLPLLFFVIGAAVAGSSEENQDRKDASTATIHVPAEMKSALEALLPEARFAICMLKGSAPANGKTLQPPFRLIVYGDSVMADYEDNNLSRTTLKTLKKPFLRLTHVYVLAADQQSDRAEVGGSTELPGGFPYERRDYYYPDKFTADSLWSECIKDLKSDAHIPGLMVFKRNEGRLKDPNIVEVKFGIEEKKK